MEAVSIVTIKSKIPLFKGEEEAERIELILLEEVGFELVSQKGLYEVGDKAVYIQPDYNLPDTELFESFLRPGGQESKSMLGKVGGVATRIRAKKFNFHRGDAVPVFSNGILLPWRDVIKFLDDTVNKDSKIRFSILTSGISLTDLLEITKWEEPESVDKNGNAVKSGRAFPEGIYKTDETNINNLWNHIEKNLGYPIRLIGTEKVDGSSITIGVKGGVGFICSRNLEKNLTVKKHIGRRDKTILEKISFWKEVDLNLYEEVINNDDFVVHGKPILDLLLTLGYDNIVLRGELNGGSLKGSGNKNNPSSREPANIKIFGADEINDAGIAVRITEQDFFGIIKDLSLNTPKVVFNNRFESRAEIEAVCNNYFKTNLIEGIVIRNLGGTFSAKFMNNEYDSKK